MYARDPVNRRLPHDSPKMLYHIGIICRRLLYIPIDRSRSSIISIDCVAIHPMESKSQPVRITREFFPVLLRHIFQPESGSSVPSKTITREHGSIGSMHFLEKGKDRV